MAASVSNSRLPSSLNFDLIKDSMLQNDDLPLAEVLDSDQWQETFAAMGSSLARRKMQSTPQRLRCGH